MARTKLMGAAEIQERLGVSRARAYQLVNRKGFPEPYAVLAMGSVWAADDVEEWIRTNRPKLAEDPEASDLPPRDTEE